MPIPLDYDVPSTVVGILVFALPLTLLMPDFSIWDYIPKTEVTRYFIFRMDFTWHQLNGICLILVFAFFCLYLEIRKRKLDEMVANVLNVSKATTAIIEVERDRQSAAMRTCVELLDSSGEHYENLILLKNEFRKRQSQMQQPPAVEPSTSQIE